MIGILGGTFDPVHHGHLRIALDAAEALQLEQIRLIPLGQAVHREQPLASSAQRLEMLHLAVDDHPLFQIDDREIQRGGDSYMIDTLISLHRDLPGKSLCLLLGSDAFNGFMRWRDPEGILAHAHLAVLQRPGYRLPDDVPLHRLTEAHRAEADHLGRARNGGIAFVNVTQLEIASSDIRQRIREDRDPAWLLPDAVNDYILVQKLYRREADQRPMV